jgi:uncharacterized protein YndB with AHSA1/START domain
VSYDLQIERVIDAPRETVLAAWGSAARVREWFTPKPLTTVALDQASAGWTRTLDQLAASVSRTA